MNRDTLAELAVELTRKWKEAVNVPAQRLRDGVIERLKGLQPLEVAFVVAYMLEGCFDRKLDEPHIQAFLRRLGLAVDPD